MASLAPEPDLKSAIFSGLRPSLYYSKHHIFTYAPRLCCANADLAAAQQRSAAQDRELSSLRALAAERDGALAAAHGQLAAAREELEAARRQLQGARRLRVRSFSQPDQLGIAAVSSPLNGVLQPQSRSRPAHDAKRTADATGRDPWGAQQRGGAAATAELQARLAAKEASSRKYKEAVRALKVCVRLCVTGRALLSAASRLECHVPPLKRRPAGSRGVTRVTLTLVPQAKLH